MAGAHRSVTRRSPAATEHGGVAVPADSDHHFGRHLVLRVPDDEQLRLVAVVAMGTAGAEHTAERGGDQYTARRETRLQGNRASVCYDVRLRGASGAK